jgi:hypothetical protein
MKPDAPAGDRRDKPPREHSASLTLASHGARRDRLRAIELIVKGRALKDRLANGRVLSIVEAHALGAQYDSGAIWFGR